MSCLSSFYNSREKGNGYDRPWSQHAPRLYVDINKNTHSTLFPGCRPFSGLKIRAIIVQNWLFFLKIGLCVFLDLCFVFRPCTYKLEKILTQNRQSVSNGLGRKHEKLSVLDLSFPNYHPQRLTGCKTGCSAQNTNLSDSFIIMI